MIAFNRHNRIGPDAGEQEGESPDRQSPPARRVVSPDWPIAAHEAAHCVAACSFGWPVVNLNIDAGKCRVDRPPILISRRLSMSLAVVRMAGSVGEGLANKAVGIPANEVHNESDMAEVTRLAAQSYPDPDQIEERDRFYARAVKRAIDLVEKHRQLVLDLATALLERREMDRDAIERVLLASLTKENA